MSKNALKIENLFVNIGERNVLSQIDLEIQKGEQVLLLGSNGAGKSTLIQTIMKERKPSQGKIYVGKVGLIAQDPRQSTYDSLTVKENCLLRTRRPFMNHLHRFLPQLTQMMDTPVAQLSGGERQVLALALCLLDPPDLLLLDEHTSALDPQTADRVMELTTTVLKEGEIAALMITHNLQHAQSFGSRVIGLKQGRIQLDAPFQGQSQLLAIYQNPPPSSSSLF